MNWFLVAIGALAITGAVGLSYSPSHQAPQAQAFSWFATKTPTRTPTPTATPSPGTTSPFAPPECASMLFNTVYNNPSFVGSYVGTAGNDLIIIKEGEIKGGAGNDCLVLADGGGSQAYGEQGNDVLITRWQPSVDEPTPGDILDGSFGTDRCIGLSGANLNCEATN